MNTRRWYANENTLYAVGAVLTILVAVTLLGEGPLGSRSEEIFVPTAPAMDFEVAPATLPSLPSLEEDVMDLTLPVPAGYTRPGAFGSIPAAPAFTAELPVPELAELPSLAERIEIPALTPMAYPKPGRVRN